MNKTPIPWAHYTWNPITGCTKGCEYCYARGIARRFGQNDGGQRYMAAEAHRGDKAFPVGFFPTMYPHRLHEPLKLRQPSRIFLGSMGDLFDAAFPDEFRDRVLATVAATPQHTYLLLTKQPANMHAYWSRPDRHNELELAAERHRIGDPHPDMGDKHMLPSLPLRNLHLGVTVTNQADADERIPLLLDTPAAVRWVSVEPMLGPVCLECPHDDEISPPWLTGLDWVVVGGKTPGKPLHEQAWCCVGNTGPTCDRTTSCHSCPQSWLRSLRDQCEAAGVPFFYKHGSTIPELDGKAHDARPEVSR